MTAPQDEELAFAGVARLGGLLRAGEVTPRELVEVYLARIDWLNPRLNAFASVRAEEALADRSTGWRAGPRSKSKSEPSRRVPSKNSLRRGIVQTEFPPPTPIGLRPAASNCALRRPTLLVRNASRSDAGDRRRRARHAMQDWSHSEDASVEAVSSRYGLEPWFRFGAVLRRGRGAPALRGFEACRPGGPIPALRRPEARAAVSRWPQWGWSANLDSRESDPVWLMVRAWHEPETGGVCVFEGGWQFGDELGDEGVV
jgi:hypothetical protein